MTPTPRARISCVALAILVVVTMTHCASAQMPLGHYQPGIFSSDAIGGLPPVSGVFASEFFVDYNKLEGKKFKALEKIDARTAQRLIDNNKTH